MNQTGGRVTIWQSTGRHLAKILSTVTLLIGFMMVGWTARKQGLHDLLARTVVIHKRRLQQAPAASLGQN